MTHMNLLGRSLGRMLPIIHRIRATAGSRMGLGVTRRFLGVVPLFRRVILIRKRIRLTSDIRLGNTTRDIDGGCLYAQRGF